MIKQCHCEITKIKNKSKFLLLVSRFIPIRKYRLQLREAGRRYARIVEYKELIKNGNVGVHTYISKQKCPNKDRICIGKYCSIAREVKLGLSNHPTNFLTTHPFTYHDSEFVPYFVDIKAPKEKLIKFEIFDKINIGNDVWIGSRAIIMDGVNIGDGAIIGANAVVTKDIPPYAIAVGSPARVVKYRFEPEIIEKLLEIKWWDFPEDFIVNNLPFDDIEKCITILQNNIHLRKD